MTPNTLYDPLIRPRTTSAPSPSTFRMAAATIWSPPTRSARARSPPISSCATTRWCRRRRKSTSSRLRCPAHCRTRPPLPRSRPAAGAMPQAGFDLDLAGLKTGNVTRVSYKDNITGITHNLSIMRVDDPRILPLSNKVTREPNDEVSASISPVAWPPSSTNSTRRSAPAPACNSRIRARLHRYCKCSMTVRRTGPMSSRPRLPRQCRRSPAATSQLPLFTDGGSLYTGALSANGSQQTGLAGRISVNTRAARRSLPHHRLLDQSAHRGGRYQALRFHHRHS